MVLSSVVVWRCCWLCGVVVGGVVLLLVIRFVVVYCYCWWCDAAVGCAMLLLLVARCGVVMFVMSC